MCVRALVLLSILNVCIGSAFAYQDWYVMNDFGNVKTRLLCHYRQASVEPGKACIMGELARRLAEELRYTKPVFLDFGVTGTWFPPEYWVSFDDGEITAVEDWASEKPVLMSPGIVVRQRSGRLDPSVTLSLLEYAIRNEDMIQSEQRPRTDRYRRINSIDITRIQEILRKPVSPTIQRVWKTRVLAPKTKTDKPLNSSRVSYSFENGLFVVYGRNSSGGEKALLFLKDLYDFQELTYHDAMVFDTQESFYYVTALPHRCSRRHVIEDTHDFHGRYNVVPLGYDTCYDKIAICFAYWAQPAPGEQSGAWQKEIYNVLIYYIEHDDLLQDLDAVLTGKGKE